MTEIFLHIFLEKEGQICINNSHYLTLKEGQKIKLKMNINDYFLLEYKPINNSNYLAFLSKITINKNTLETQSKNICIIELSSNNFYLLILPSKSIVRTLNSQKSEIKTNGKKIVFNGEKLEILDKGKFKEIEICKSPTNFNIEVINQTLILFSKEKIKNNLHLIHLNNDKHIKLDCDKYQNKNQEIQCIKNLKTYAKHKKIKVFNAEDLSLKDEFIGYETLPRKVLPKAVIPYAFFQNIFAGDFNLAQKFLDEKEYSTKLNKSAIQGFFGDFESFGTPQISTPNNTICLIYKKNKNIYNCRYFTFELNNENKIVNIYEYKSKMNF